VVKDVIYPRCAIIGIGLIGGSFALAGKRAGVLGHVVGMARTEATRKAALEIGAADTVTDGPAEACDGADLVYLATPVGAIPGLLPQIADELAEGCTVTDAGSTKAAIVAAAREVLPEHVTFIGGHPMAGSEQSSIAAARADLFEGSVYFLTADDHTNAAALDKLRQSIEALGAVPTLCDAGQHDRIVAATSHLPHLVACALARSVAEVVSAQGDVTPYIGKGFADSTRLAAGPTDVWCDILLANREHMAEGLGRLVLELQSFTATLRDGDAEALARLLDDARHAREELLGR